MIITERLDDLLRLVARADAAIMEVYDARSAVVELKGDDTPLTQADMASHHILSDGLMALFPDIPVVSEEGDQAENARIVQSQRFWLVDPLDGTKEFIKRTDEFTVCVALIEQGAPTFGIISAPALGMTYYGGLAFGSFKLKAEEAALPIRVSKQSVGVVLGSRSFSEQGTATYIAEHYPDAEIKAVGSQLKFPYIAEGLADVYPRLGTTMRLWDVAAGQAILEGAGGYVARPDGSAIDYQATTLLAGDFVATS